MPYKNTKAEKEEAEISAQIENLKSK